MGLNQTQCQSKPSAYLRLLMQLLPHGLAWQWDEKSAGRHLLAAFSEEMHRVHAFFCDVAEASIQRFETTHYGWSFENYEQLLLNKFGLVATVSDAACHPLQVDFLVGEPVYNQRIVYTIDITVDDLSVITPQIKRYLKQYKQSHTTFCYRDRKVSATTAYDIEALNADNAEVDSLLYEQDWHAVDVFVHPSWKWHELPQLTGWEQVKTLFRENTNIRRVYAQD